MPNSKNLLPGGVKGNKGGGRHKEEFLIWCRKLSSSPKARKFITALIEGDPIEEKTIFTPGSEPVTILVSASAETRRRALADIWDRAHGKPMQAVELGGPDGKEFTVKLVNYGNNAPASL